MYAADGELTSAILVDLFGVCNWPTHVKATAESFTDRVNTLNGLYQGLWIMNIPWETIESHRKANTLDHLIDSSYSNRSSAYYREYKEHGIKIGKTHV